MKIPNLVAGGATARFLPTLLLGLALAVASTAAEPPKVVGVLFHADWCSSCKALAPKLAAVKPDFAGQPVLFTQVDFTDDSTRAQADLLAAWLELGPAYAEQGRKTGFMLLLDGRTRRVLGRLTKTQGEEELRATIAQALQAAGG